MCGIGLTHVTEHGAVLQTGRTARGGPYFASASSPGALWLGTISKEVTVGRQSVRVFTGQPRWRLRASGVTLTLTQTSIRRLLIAGLHGDQQQGRWEGSVGYGLGHARYRPACCRKL